MAEGTHPHSFTNTQTHRLRHNKRRCNRTRWFGARSRTGRAPATGRSVATTASQCSRLPRSGYRRAVAAGSTQLDWGTPNQPRSTKSQPPAVCGTTAGPTRLESELVWSRFTRTAISSSHGADDELTQHVHRSTHCIGNTTRHTLLQRHTPVRTSRASRRCRMGRQTTSHVASSTRPWCSAARTRSAATTAWRCGAPRRRGTPPRATAACSSAFARRCDG